MFIRLVTFFLVGLALTGCVLESKEPLISKDAGVPMLEPYGSRFATYSLDGDVWKKDEDTITLRPERNHYIVSEGNDSVAVTFAPISGSWWAMQAEEAGKPPTYSLIGAHEDEILVYPLNCGPLRKLGKFDAFISFEGEDCIVKTGVDANSMFKALAAEPGKPGMKLVPLP